MSRNTTINNFVNQSPVESLNQPNKETIIAMTEAERIAKDSSVKGYDNLDEMFDELKNE